jgi:hypothetical protein
MSLRKRTQFSVRLTGEQNLKKKQETFFNPPRPRPSRKNTSDQGKVIRTIAEDRFLIKTPTVKNAEFGFCFLTFWHRSFTFKF